MKKKILSLIVSVAMVMTVFAGMTVTASADDVAATTAFPAGNTQWIAPNSLHARSVFSFIPPLPMITRTPDSFTNSYSNFSIRILVVGPTDTISNLSFSSGRMIGPA